jgi:hypothetical protein
LRQKLVYGLALISIFLFFSTTIINASATTYTVGVTAGTTASYNVTQTGYTSSTTVTLKVTSVSGTTITYSETGALPNGTTEPVPGTGDVSTGTAFPFFIGANLGPGDVIGNEYGFVFTINDTETMTIGGASRSVNHLNWTFALMGTVLFALNLYWDKPTGMVAEWQFYTNTTIGLGGSGGSGASWLNMTMTSAGITVGSTGSGAPSGLSSTELLLIGVVVVVVVVLALVLVLRRRRK